MLPFLLLFVYTISLSFTLPLIFSHMPFLFFAPLLVNGFYHYTKIRCLWLALICGLVGDLFSAQTRLGFYALTYCLTVECLYRYKYHFFEDSLSTLSILTCLFSILSTLFQVLLLYLFGQGLVLSWQWFSSDLIWMPLYDGLYAFLAFSLPPFALFKYRRRRLFVQ